jgi:hypothetical protein
MKSLISIQSHIPAEKWVSSVANMTGDLLERFQGEKQVCLLSLCSLFQECCLDFTLVIIPQSWQISAHGAKFTPGPSRFAFRKFILTSGFSRPYYFLCHLFNGIFQIQMTDVVAATRAQQKDLAGSLSSFKIIARNFEDEKRRSRWGRKTFLPSREQGSA